MNQKIQSEGLVFSEELKLIPDTFQIETSKKP